MRFLLILFAAIVLSGSGALGGERTPLDDTGGFIHLSPGLVRTTNGCSEFDVFVQATLTDARVFGLKLWFDEARLELISVIPGSHAALNLMPHYLTDDTLHLDGFFHPNFAAGQVVLAVLRVRAISPDDDAALIGFLYGQGYGGTPAEPELIVLDGDTSFIDIEGTMPLAPESLVIKRLDWPAYDDSVLLSWKPVRRDIDGDPVLSPLYKIFFENIVTDTIVEIGSTLDTFYYDDAIKTGANLIQYDTLGNPTDTSNHGIYFIRSCKTVH
jgi:hypothetical protein